MNTMNIHNSFNSNKNFTSKNTAFSRKDNKLFSDIFRNENKTLNFKNDTRNEFKSISEDNKQNIHSSNKSKNSFKSVLNKKNVDEHQTINEEKNISNSENTDEKKYNKKVDKLDNIQADETIEKSESNLSNEIIALIESLMKTDLIDLSQLQKDINVEIKLDETQIEALNNLKEKLSVLLETVDLELNQVFKENIKKAIELLNEITGQSSVDVESNKLVSSKDVEEILSIIEDIKTNMNLNSNKPISNQKNNFNELISNNKDQLQNTEIEKNNGDEENVQVSEDIVDEDSVENFKKLLSNDNSTKPNFLKQHSNNNSIIQNQNALEIKAELQSQKTDVSILENETIDHKQFINEVAQKASVFISENKNEMSIQLTPEKLGKLSIKIGLNDGTMTGKIYAENYSVKEIIEANLSQLKDALEEKGVNIGGLEVNVGHDSQSSDRNLYHSSFNSRKKHKGIPISNNVIGTFEEKSEIINPYLTTNKFDGLV